LIALNFPNKSLFHFFNFLIPLEAPFTDPKLAFPEGGQILNWQQPSFARAFRDKNSSNEFNKARVVGKRFFNTTSNNLFFHCDLSCSFSGFTVSLNLAACPTIYI
jgi:hypothetical protein